MAARLLWRDAQGNEGAIDLAGEEALVGRAVDCAIRTDDAMVSRHHARVTWRGDAFYVEDLGSSNGIYYQEQRVTRHALRHGDALRCGSLWLRYLEGAAEAGAPGAAMAAPAAAAPVPAPAATPAQVSESHPPSAGLETGAEPPSPAPPGRPPPSPIPSSNEGAASEEIRRLQRRVEQLQAELRVYRGGGETAQRMEELESEVATLGDERDELKKELEAMRATFESEGGDAKVRRAGEIQHRAGEIVASLNDVLSNIRINVMAAEGEFEQFHDALPRPSFELIREALKSSAADMETAREMMRDLRSLAGA